jgi:hypothetical protein
MQNDDPELYRIASIFHKLNLLQKSMQGLKYNALDAKYLNHKVVMSGSHVLEEEQSPCFEEMITYPKEAVVKSHTYNSLISIKQNQPYNLPRPTTTHALDRPSLLPKHSNLHQSNSSQSTSSLSAS